MKKKLFYSISCLIALWLCYLSSRYLFFSLHGMKDWPWLLFMLGCALIFIGTFINAYKAMMMTPIGYLFGFIFGIIFQVTSYDPGGGARSNDWLIWATTYFISVALGLSWDLIFLPLKKRKLGINNIRKDNTK